MDLTSPPFDPFREDLCRALFERAADGIFITDQQLHFVEVNPRGCEMLDYSRQEILALSLVDLILDEDLARALLRLDDLRAGKTLVGKCSLRCGNARLLPAEIRSQMLPDGRLLCNVHDLTERQQVEIALRKSEERLDLALKGAELGTWDWHVPTGEVIFNERWVEMLGYTLAEIEPHVRSWEKLLHPDDAPEVMKILTAHLEGDTPLYQTEHRLLAKSGEWKWVLDTGKVFTRDERGQPIRVVGTHQDITGRRRAESQREAALAERERLLAAEREQRLQAETLAEVVLALTSHIDVEEVLDEILRQAQRVVPFSTANIELLEGGSLHVVRGYGYEAFGCEDLVANFSWPLADLPLDAEAIQARRALIVSDARSEPRWATTPGTEWIRSFLMVPICSHERVLGILGLDSDVPGRFTVEDAERLEPLANAAAVALENARLYDQAQREIVERVRVEAEREKLIAELQAALAQVRRLSGLLPICASCKKIRDDKGYWQQVEVYIHDHAEVEFSHGICPDCREKLYPRGDYPYLYTEPTEQGDENLSGATR